MITFKAYFKKFGENGWTYILISNKQANQLKANTRVSFWVKGKLDSYAIERKSLFPRGDGTFILPVNAIMRKGTGKKRVIH